MDFKYKISVVMPIYNTEDYLEEAVESLINQTIGFDSIQLILVNDGSVDRSGDICKKYKESYDNVVYVEKENGGASSARNKGLEYVEGKYVNFLDSDDLWDEDALFQMYNFMEENYDDIDFVSARLKYFEACEDYHYLDFKFDKTRVVDIEKEPEMIIFHSATSLIKSEAIRDKRFDSRLKVGEDTLLLNKILLNKCKYGVIREVVYNYRRRNTGDSAVQSNFKNRTWFFDTPKYLWQGLIDDSREMYGRVIDYIQFVLLYEIKWRINCKYVILNYLDVKRHLEIVKSTLECVDEKIIDECGFVDEEEKKILREIKRI